MRVRGDARTHSTFFCERSGFWEKVAGVRYRPRSLSTAMGCRVRYAWFALLCLCGCIFLWGFAVGLTKWLSKTEVVLKSAFFPKCTSSYARGCDGLQGLVIPNLTLLLGLLCAFGCQLLDAGFSFAGVLTVSNRLSRVVDGDWAELTIWP